MVTPLAGGRLCPAAVLSARLSGNLGRVFAQDGTVTGIVATMNFPGIIW